MGMNFPAILNCVLLRGVWSDLVREKHEIQEFEK